VSGRVVDFAWVFWAEAVDQGMLTHADNVALAQAVLALRNLGANKEKVALFIQSWIKARRQSQ
jgi:hypothetical protein